MSYCVYKHTSPSGKVYIGITMKNPLKRWANGLGYCRQSYFFNAILKYGWDNFTHEILYTGLTKEEACQKEIELIALYRSNQRKYGYNISSGGECPNKGSRKDGVHRSKPKQYNYITYEGETHTLTEWSKILNIPRETLAYRNKNNIDLRGEKAQVLMACDFCGKPLKNKRNKYCSPQCQYNALRTSQKTAICKGCGKEFFYSARRRKGVFCSRKCYLNHV